MEKELERIKNKLQERAMLGLLDRLADVKPSLPEYKSMFENLSRYIYNVEVTSSIQELLTDAGDSNLSYSGIFSVEDFLETFFTCKL